MPGPLQFPHHLPACQSLPAPVPNSALSLSEGFFLNANLIMSETSDGSLTVFGIKSRPLHPAEDALCDLDRPHRQSGAPFPSQSPPPHSTPQPHRNYRLFRATSRASCTRSHSNLLHSIRAPIHSIVITDLLPPLPAPRTRRLPWTQEPDFLSLYFQHLAQYPSTQ